MLDTEMNSAQAWFSISSLQKRSRNKFGMTAKSHASTITSLLWKKMHRYSGLWWKIGHISRDYDKAI